MDEFKINLSVVSSIKVYLHQYSVVYTKEHSYDDTVMRYSYLILLMYNILKVPNLLNYLCEFDTD